MLNMKELIYKAETQKTIKADIVLEVCKPYQERYLELLKKRQVDLDNYNKKVQLMNEQNKRLKARIRKLQKEVDERLSI